VPLLLFPAGHLKIHGSGVPLSLLKNFLSYLIDLGFISPWNRTPSPAVKFPSFFFQPRRDLLFKTLLMIQFPPPRIPNIQITNPLPPTILLQDIYKIPPHLYCEPHKFNTQNLVRNCTNSSCFTESPFLLFLTLYNFKKVLRNFYLLSIHPIFFF